MTDGSTGLERGAVTPAAVSPRSVFPNIISPNPATDDSAITLNACAIGWSLTEVLGRAYETQKYPSDIDWSETVPRPLPLADERSPAELKKALTVYIWRILQALSLGELTVAAGQERDGYNQYVDIVKVIVDKMCRRTPPLSATDYTSCRKELNIQLYLWDQQLQDVLPSISQRGYAGYQAARGLADLTWMCQYQDDEERNRIAGEQRTELLGRLILSLNSAFKSAYTAPALKAGLESWAPALQAKQYSEDQLRLQARIWRDLITGARQPETYLPDRLSFKDQLRFVGKVLQANMAALTIALLFAVIAGIIAAAIFRTGVAASIVAVVGGVGLVKWLTDHFETAAADAGRVIWQEAQQTAINQQVIIPPFPAPTKAQNRPLSKS